MIERLDALLDEATERPWRYGWDDGSGKAEAWQGGSITALEGADSREVVAGGRDSWGIPVGVRREADATLIAEAVNALPRLLAVVRAVEMALDASDTFRGRDYLRAALAALDTEGEG